VSECVCVCVCVCVRACERDTYVEKQLHVRVCDRDRMRSLLDLTSSKQGGRGGERRMTIDASVP
jgi:hypothetical protein